MSEGQGLKSVKIYAYAVLAMLFWGLSFVWFKQVNRHFEPLSIIFFRLIISGALLLLFQWLSKGTESIRKADLRWFFLLAFTQPFCYFLGESFGLSLVSSTVAAVIITTIPLFSPIAAFLAFREKVSREVLTGIFFSFTGIVIMLINPDFSLSADPAGILLLFVAVFAAVAYSVVIRKLAYSYRPVTIITMQNLIGAVYFLPLFLVFDLKDLVNVKPDYQTWIALFELAVFASTLSYLFYIISIKEIGIVKANVLTNLIPVFTAIFSYFVLKEGFTAAKIIGVFIVIIGILISQYRSLKLMFSGLVNK